MERFLVGHLTAPRAALAPLVVLGQPGSGKSLLTRVLAARLPVGEFLVVRVPLREAPSDTDIQGQIEYAVRSATGEVLTWPDVARSADGALSVILFDGFDELLQASGVSQADYLQRIHAFQQREWDQGRPVAVLVTSRVSVADRARPVPGMIALKIEPFREGAVSQWLETWSGLNAGALAVRGLKPLQPEVAMSYPDLASQPLLLFMLALFDAESNSLQRDAHSMRQSDLYEGLLGLFANRELSKSTELSFDGGTSFRAVETELTRLSIAAFGMFNRRRQSIAELELQGDLEALLEPDLDEQSRSGTGDRPATTAAQRFVGRFYFIHESQAMRDGARLRVYEFLHATFAEYLAARLIVRELEHMIAGEQLARVQGRPATAVDSTLHAILSFAPLYSCGLVLPFASERFSDMAADQRVILRDVLLRLFRSSLNPRNDTRANGYAPIPASSPARCSAYSANLLLLAVGAELEIDSADLFPHSDDSVREWSSLALLWRSQLPDTAGLARYMAVERIWIDTHRVIRVSKRSGDRSSVSLTSMIDWSCEDASDGDRQARRWAGSDPTDLIDSAALLCDPEIDVLLHALARLIDTTGPAVLTAFNSPGRGSITTSAAHAFVNLLIARATEFQPSRLARAYEEVARLADVEGVPAGLENYRKVVLAMLAKDRQGLSDVSFGLIEAILGTGTSRRAVERLERRRTGSA